MLPRPLPRSRVIWPTAIAALAALDWWADRGEPDGDTLTELVRTIFHTDTARGRIALAATLGGGGVFLYGHFSKIV